MLSVPSSLVRKSTRASRVAFAVGTLESFSLDLVRTSALVIAAPFLGMALGFSGHKIGLIAAIAFLLYGVSGTPLAHSPSPIEYGCLVLREILIGSFLAFTLHLASLAVRTAGELIGQEMGYNMAQIADPATGVNTPVVSELYESLFLLGVLAALVRAALLALRRAQRGDALIMLGQGITSFCPAGRVRSCRGGGGRATFLAIESGPVVSLQRCAWKRGVPATLRGSSLGRRLPCCGGLHPGHESGRSPPAPGRPGDGRAAAPRRCGWPDGPPR